MSSGEHDVRKVIIIGSGPAGYTSAIYAARAELQPLMIAGAITAGGELMNTTEVENFPGFPKGIMGPELMENMQEQAERFGTEILYDDVTEVCLETTPKKVVLSDGTTYYGQTIIISTGAAYRHLNIPGEKRLSGHGVSWCATCDGFFFKEQDIAVVGGGDSAMEEATFLTKFARTVKIIHRGCELRASKIMQERAKNNDKIDILYNTQVKEINGQTTVESITTFDSITGEEKSLHVSGLFIAIGQDPRVDLFKDVITLTQQGTIAVKAQSSLTNVPGVFAAGDVVDFTYRQAITAAGSGCVAAIDAEHYLASL